MIVLPRKSLASGIVQVIPRKLGASLHLRNRSWPKSLNWRALSGRAVSQPFIGQTLAEQEVFSVRIEKDSLVAILQKTRVRCRFGATAGAHTLALRVSEYLGRTKSNGTMPIVRVFKANTKKRRITILSHAIVPTGEVPAVRVPFVVIV